MGKGKPHRCAKTSSGAAHPGAQTPFLAGLGHHQGFLGLAEEEQGLSSPPPMGQQLLALCKPLFTPPAGSPPWWAQTRSWCSRTGGLQSVGGERGNQGGLGAAYPRGPQLWGWLRSLQPPPLSPQARGAAAEGRRVRQHVAAAAAGWGRGREQGAAHREAPRQQEGAMRRAGGSAVTPKQGSGSPWCRGTPAGGCGSVCAPGAAGTGLDTPLRLYPFGLLVCSSLKSGPSQLRACVLWARCLQGSPGLGAALRAGMGTRGGHRLCQGVPTSTEGCREQGAVQPVPALSPRAATPTTVPPSAPLQIAALSLLLPHSHSAPRAMPFIFSRAALGRLFSAPAAPGTAPRAGAGPAGKAGEEAARGGTDLPQGAARTRPQPGESAPACGARGCCCSRGDALQHGCG